MSGPSKKSWPSSGEPENVLVYIERVLQQAEEFQKTVEKERAILEALLVRQAKRRGHERSN